jgi:hypothetical protein
MVRIRYTMLAVTLNSNKAATTAAEEQLYKQELARVIREDLSAANNWRELLPTTTTFDVIDHIDISAIGVERGGVRHRIHAHFVVTVQHHGKLLVPKQRTWQDFFNRKLHFTKGSYAVVELMNARRLNYATKNAGTVKQLAAIGVQEEVKF